MLRSNWIMLALLTVAAFSAPAAAQYPAPVYGNQVPIFGPGAVLQGSASVINASGNLQIQQQQARQQYQVGEQEKLKTRKQAFDLAAYEKANTPSFTETQEGVKAMQIQRMMTMANQAEISRGDTLNALLPMVRSFAEQGVPAPPYPLDAKVVAAINVSGGAGDPGLGMLKNGPKITWPFMMRGPQQKKIDQQLAQTMTLAAKDELTPDVYNQTMKAVKDYQEDWRKEFHKEKIDGGTFLNGKKFLDSLEVSVKGLQNPDAVAFLNGTMSIKGNNVPEIVYNLTQKGLKFAPCNPGQENAYNALHSAFVAYAREGQASAGFTSAAAQQPPSQFQPKKK